MNQTRQGNQEISCGQEEQCQTNSRFLFLQNFESVEWVYNLTAFILVGRKVLKKKLPGSLLQLDGLCLLFLKSKMSHSFLRPKFITTIYSQERKTNLIVHLKKCVLEVLCCMLYLHHMSKSIFYKKCIACVLLIN